MPRNAGALPVQCRQQRIASRHPHRRYEIWYTTGEWTWRREQKYFHSDYPDRDEAVISGRYIYRGIRPGPGGRRTGRHFRSDGFSPPERHVAGGRLIGRDKINRIEPSETGSRIGLDDWRKASDKLPGETEQAFSTYDPSIADTFLAAKAVLYVPLA